MQKRWYSGTFIGVLEAHLDEGATGVIDNVVIANELQLSRRAIEDCYIGRIPVQVFRLYMQLKCYPSNMSIRFVG